MQDPAALRQRLWQLLGEVPRPTLPKVNMIARDEKARFTQEHFSFSNALGDMVYGYLLLPNGINYPAPAVLYHHEHGHKYPLGKNAALQIRENGYAPGIALVEAGFVVMAIDAYGFGQRERQGTGRRRGKRRGHGAFALQALSLAGQNALGHDDSR